MVTKYIVHMHIIAELKAYWLYFSVRCDAIGSTPITYMNFDFDPPYHGLPSFLDHKDLMNLLTSVSISTLNFVLLEAECSQILWIHVLPTDPFWLIW